MFRRTIEYEDFDDNKCSEVFYFNISKPEIIKLEAKYTGGFGNFLQRLLESQNNDEMVKQFDEIIMMAYGEKTEDGKHFDKSEAVKAKFKDSAAYNQLFMELATDENSLLEFVRQVFPKDLVFEIDQAKLDALKAQKQTVVAVPDISNVPPQNEPPPAAPQLPNMPTR